MSEELRSRVDITDIVAKVKKTTYTRLPESTTIVCQMHMENGFTVLGSSACVNPENFNQALGEKYAYEDAINEAWTLEGYLLAQQRYEQSLKN